MLKSRNCAIKYVRKQRISTDYSLNDVMELRREKKFPKETASRVSENMNRDKCQQMGDQNALLLQWNTLGTAPVLLCCLSCYIFPLI